MDDDEPFRGRDGIHMDNDVNFLITIMRKKETPQYPTSHYGRLFISEHPHRMPRAIRVATFQK